MSDLSQRLREHVSPRYIAELVSADLILASAERIEALERENAALTADRDFLQEIIDGRPAINQALPESYIRWSQSIYSSDAVRAQFRDAKERKV